jgi:hypothetical protein
MSSLSAIVLTRNEERHLSDCLKGLQWADEVLVLDSESTDYTREIATDVGARVLIRPFSNYGDQRQAALELAHGRWVLFVDADECVPPKLAAEIRTIVSRDGPEVGWWVPRRNFFWGHEVRYTGWAPDYQLRLLRRSYASYDPTAVVHEVARLDGPDGYLQTPLIHFNYDSWNEFFAKQAMYARYEVPRWYVEGRRVRWRTFFLQPPRAFWRRYVKLRGFGDCTHLLSY